MPISWSDAILCVALCLAAVTSGTLTDLGLWFLLFQAIA